MKTPWHHFEDQAEFTRKQKQTEADFKESQSNLGQLSGEIEPELAANIRETIKDIDDPDKATLGQQPSLNVEEMKELQDFYNDTESDQVDERPSKYWKVPRLSEKALDWNMERAYLMTRRTMRKHATRHLKMLAARFFGDRRRSFESQVTALVAQTLRDVHEKIPKEKWHEAGSLALTVHTCLAVYRNGRQMLWKAFHHTSKWVEMSILCRVALDLKVQMAEEDFVKMTNTIVPFTTIDDEFVMRDRCIGGVDRLMKFA